MRKQKTGQKPANEKSPQERKGKEREIGWIGNELAFLFFVRSFVRRRRLSGGAACCPIWQRHVDEFYRSRGIKSVFLRSEEQVHVQNLQKEE